MSPIELTAMYVNLVRPHLARVKAYIDARIDTAQDAEDVLSETLQAAYRSLPDFDETAPVLPWLDGIAGYKIDDRFRAQRRQPRVVALGFAACSVPARDDVVRTCAAQEEIEWCRGCIGRHLPPMQFRALFLAEFCRCTEHEAAAEMGISLVQYKHLLHRARVTMRRLSCGGCRVVDRDEAAPDCPLRRRPDPSPPTDHAD